MQTLTYASCDLVLWLEQVIVYGVDGNPYPGFRFPEGGAEAFMAAVSQEYVIEEVGEMTSPAGLRDQTYNLGKPKSKGKGKVNHSRCSIRRVQIGFGQRASRLGFFFDPCFAL